MARKLHARRYAEAIFEIARESGQLNEWKSDLGKIVTLLESPEVGALLENPKLHFETKVKFLKERLADIGPMALNFLQLLIARNRLSIAGEVYSQYHELVDSYQGIEHARVVTAVALSDDEKEKLKGTLRAMTGKEIVLTSEVDPGVLGGIVVRVGDKLINGSTLTRLLALKKELAGAGS